MSASTEAAPRIQQLSTSVINKIAAGEVIERPASVVKELLENSVDALSTRIEVDIEQGGAELIRIVDDGEGIHPDDVPLAIASHATSKITGADDLFHVQTMGFRGEALASISEVSRFRLRTRQADQLAGVEMQVDGGNVSPLQPCGCPPGTQIEIRELFFNTPVRRKFLKTPATEFAHISEQFTRVALANPRLHMVLRHNNKSVYELPATDRLIDRLELFFGSQLAESLIPIERSSGELRVWGYVAQPRQSKATRKGQYLFLNGRWIQDRSLQHALTEAYRGLLMVGRQPIAYLFFEVPASQVDVNVHPTKSEVRFRDSQQMYRLLLSTLRNTFLGMDLDSPLSLRSDDAGSRGNASAVEVEKTQRELVDWANDQLSRWKPTEDLSDLEAAMPASPPVTPADPPAMPSESGSSPAAFDTDADASSASPAMPGSVAPGASTSDAAPADVPAASAEPSDLPETPRALQVHDCYLVVETREGITVIDQHALHERIMYEHLRRRVLGGAIEVQRLLMPVTIELSSREAGLLLDRTELLAELGLLVEPFGGNSVMLSGYPTMLAKADPAELLRAVVEQIDSAGQSVTRRDLLDSLLHMMSCKAAIKAGQRLKPEEIDSLLAQRHLVDDHHHCPHGRPTALTLSRSELDRQFGRLG
ncbi:DNA mismatch repair protein MutL [Maioricimonas rarisocia]|uniref:DNA mismatch repair protein MutL n=1 Tax=Maioricimonas rarisocia TaxID=2528026 RepID=A0A517Z252_9PLAN|nr:DNA mismatch repair endonuclease MutL [Maioricimonas rarisocia]QDU36551.1 DNA mismatch repair protein MutL [Maioricimonas rarisocia]